MTEWIADNWEKVATFVLSVAAAVWAAARRFTKRIDALEADVAWLRGEVGRVKGEQTQLEDKIMKSLERLDERFKEVVDLKSWMERSEARTDVILKTIQEDIRELKDDVKRLMRDE